MGCLVDTFVIVSKYQWMGKTDTPLERDLRAMLLAIPEQYRMMLRALLVRFGSLDLIMDNRDFRHAKRVMEAAEPFETETVKFTDRYRGECLQQIMRKTFYDTLLIVENDYNEYKYNYFIVLRSNQVISEEHLKVCAPEDQLQAALAHRRQLFAKSPVLISSYCKTATRQ